MFWSISSFFVGLTFFLTALIPSFQIHLFRQALKKTPRTKSLVNFASSARAGQEGPARITLDLECPQRETWNKRRLFQAKERSFPSSFLLFLSSVGFNTPSPQLQVSKDSSRRFPKGSSGFKTSLLFPVLLNSFASSALSAFPCPLCYLKSPKSEIFVKSRDQAIEFSNMTPQKKAGLKTFSRRSKILLPSFFFPPPLPSCFHLTLGYVYFKHPSCWTSPVPTFHQRIHLVSTFLFIWTSL